MGNWEGKVVIGKPNVISEAALDIFIIGDYDIYKPFHINSFQLQILRFSLLIHGDFLTATPPPFSTKNEIIPSETEIALRYTLLTLFPLFILFKITLYRIDINENDFLETDPAGD